MSSEEELRPHVLSSTVADPSSNVEWIQTPSRNFFLFGSCDGALVLEELKEGTTDRSLSLQRKFFLSRLLSPDSPITLLRVQQDRIAAVSGARIFTTTLRVLLAMQDGVRSPGDSVGELEAGGEVAALQWTQDGEGLLVATSEGQVAMWRYREAGRDDTAASTPRLAPSYQDPSVLSQPAFSFRPLAPTQAQGGPFGTPSSQPMDAPGPLPHIPGAVRALRRSQEAAKSTPDLSKAAEDSSGRGRRSPCPPPLNPLDEEGWHCVWKVAALGEVHRGVAAGSRSTSPAASCTSYVRFQPVRPTAKHVMVWWSPEADTTSLPHRLPGAVHLVPRGEILRHPTPVVSVQWSPSLSLASQRTASHSDTPLLTLTIDHVIRLWIEVRGLVPGSPNVAQFCTALVIDPPIPPSVSPSDAYSCQVQWAGVDPDHADYQRSRDILWLSAIMSPAPSHRPTALRSHSEADESPDPTGPLLREGTGDSSRSAVSNAPRNQALKPQLLLWAVAGLTGVDMSGAEGASVSPAARAPRSVLWSRASLPEGIFSLSGPIGADVGSGTPRPARTATPQVHVSCVGWYKDTAEGHHDLRLRVTGCVSPGPSSGGASRSPPPPIISRASTLGPPPPSATSIPSVGYVPPPITQPGSLMTHSVPSPAPVPPPPAHIGTAGYVPPPLIVPSGAPTKSEDPSSTHAPSYLRPRLPEPRLLFSITIDPARVTDGGNHGASSPTEPSAMRFHIRKLSGHVAPILDVATCAEYAASIDAAGNLLLWSLPELSLLASVSCRSLRGRQLSRQEQPDAEDLFDSGSVRLGWAGPAAGITESADVPRGREGQEEEDGASIPLASRPTLLIASTRGLAFVRVHMSLLSGVELEGPLPIPCPASMLSAVSGGVESLHWLDRSQDGARDALDARASAPGPREADSDSDRESEEAEEEETAQGAASGRQTDGQLGFKRADGGFLLAGRGASGVISCFFVAWRGSEPLVLSVDLPPVVAAVSALPSVPLVEQAPLLPCLPPYDLVMLTLDGMLSFATLEVPAAPGACVLVRQFSRSVLPLLSQLGSSMRHVAGISASPLGDRIALALYKAPHGPLPTPGRYSDDLPFDQDATHVHLEAPQPASVVVLQPVRQGVGACESPSLDLELLVHQVLQVGSGEEGDTDRAARSLAVLAGPSLQWEESTLLGQALLVRVGHQVTVFSATNCGRFRARLEYAPKGNTPPDQGWGRARSPSPGDEIGSPSSSSAPVGPVALSVASPGLLLVSQGASLSVVASIPLRPSHLLRRTATNAASASPEALGAYTADLSRAFGMCLPDFHPRILRLLVDAGRPDLAARLVRLLKATLERLEPAQSEQGAGKRHGRARSDLPSIVEERTVVEPSATQVEGAPGTSKRLSKVVVLRLLDALGPDLLPLESARPVQLHSTAKPQNTAGTSAPKATMPPCPAAPADPLMSGMLDMTAFGFVDSFGGLATAAGGDGAGSEYETGSDEVERAAAQQPAAGGADSGLLDMGAFAGFGFDAYSTSEGAQPKERKLRKKKKTAEPHDDEEVGPPLEPQSPSVALSVQPSSAPALAPANLLGPEDLDGLARLLVRLRVLGGEDARPYRIRALGEEEDEAPHENAHNPYRLSMKGSIFETSGKGSEAHDVRAPETPPFRVLGLDAAVARDLLAFSKAVLGVAEGQVDALQRLDVPSRALFFSLKALTVASLPSLRALAMPFVPCSAEDSDKEEGPTLAKGGMMRSDSHSSSTTKELFTANKLKTEGLGSAVLHRHGVRSIGGPTQLHVSAGSSFQRGPAASSDSLSRPASEATGVHPPGLAEEQWAYWGLARGVSFRHVYLAVRSTFSPPQLVDALLPLALALEPGRDETSESASGPSSAGFALFASTGGRAPQRGQDALELSWPVLRRMGAGYWLSDTATCRSLGERMAQMAFAATRDPYKATLMYIALGKKSVLQGLFRLTTTDSARKVFDFLSRNFNNEEHRTAAVKNAYALLSQHRYEIAAAFFLLGGAVRDGLGVLSKELGDPQLCLFVGRLLGPEGEETARGLLKDEVRARAEADLEQGLYRDDFLLPVLDLLAAPPPSAVGAKPSKLAPIRPAPQAPEVVPLVRALSTQLEDPSSSGRDCFAALDVASSLFCLLAGATACTSRDGVPSSAPSGCTLDLENALRVHEAYQALAATARRAGLAPWALAFSAASDRIAFSLFQAATSLAGPKDAALKQSLAVVSALGRAGSLSGGLRASQGSSLQRAVAELVNPSVVREVQPLVACAEMNCILRALTVHRDYVRMTKGLPESQQAQLLAHMLLKALGKMSPSRSHLNTPSISSRNLLSAPSLPGSLVLNAAPGAGPAVSPVSRTLAGLHSTLAGSAQDIEDDRESVSTHVATRIASTGGSPAPLVLDGTVPLFSVDGARTLLHLSRGGSASQTIHEPRVLGMSVVHTFACPPQDPAQRLYLLRQHPAATNPVVVCTSAHHGLHAVRLRQGMEPADEFPGTPRGVTETGEDSGFTLLGSSSHPHDASAAPSDVHVTRKPTGSNKHVPGMVGFERSSLESKGPLVASPVAAGPSNGGLSSRPESFTHHQRSGSLLAIVQDVFDSFWMGGASDKGEHGHAALDMEHLAGGDILMTTPMRSGMRKSSAGPRASVSDGKRPSVDSGRPSTAGAPPQTARLAPATTASLSRVSSESSVQDPSSPRKLLQRFGDRPHVRSVGTRAVAGHPNKPVYATGAAHGTSVFLWRLGEEQPFAQLHFDPPVHHAPIVERLSISRLGHHHGQHSTHAPSGPSSPGGPSHLTQQLLSRTSASSEAVGPAAPGSVPHSPVPVALHHQQQQLQQQQQAVVMQLHQRLKESHVTALAFSSDGYNLVAVTNTGVVAAWHLTESFLSMSQELVYPRQQQPAPPPMPLPQLHARWLHNPLVRGHAVCFLGESSSIVVAGGIGASGRDLVLCNIDLPPAVSHLVSLAVHPGGCTSVATIPQGLLLVSGGEGGDLTIHDLRMVEAGATPVLVWKRAQAHDAPVTCIGTGKLRGRDLIVTGCKSGGVRVWEARRHQLLQAIELAHHVEKKSASFLSLAFARKKEGLGGGIGAAGGMRQGSVVSSASFADEGLVTAGHDGTVRLWPWSNALTELA